MLAVVQRNLSILLSAMKKNYTRQTAVALARWLCVAATTIQGLGLVTVSSLLSGVCKTFAVAAADTARTSLLERWRPGTLHISVWPKNFRVWIYCSAWSNLTQEIQFLEFIGGSNSTHAHLNYLICMCFTTVFHAVTSMTNCLYHFQLCLILALLNSICI